MRVTLCSLFLLLAVLATGCDDSAPAAEAGGGGGAGSTDRDGDGIDDAADQCDTQPEDLDGVADDDGCPEGAGTGGTGGEGAGGSGGGSGGSGGQGGSGGSGGQGGSGGRGGSVPAGDPIAAPAETWTFVDFPDSACGNGEPTGIGVNLTDRSDKVLIYLMGGGACWDNFTCYLVGSAVHVADGYDAATFQQDVVGSNWELFDRDNPDNPVRDYSFVFVPYCTGDVHGGDRIADYNGRETHHAGFTNMTAFLKRLAPTFPGASQVLLSGSSAGGFGAMLNWEQTQDAFGASPVDVLDDCGPPLPAPYFTEQREQSWRQAWNLQLPAGCPECQEDLDAAIPYFALRYPERRFGLLHFTQDGTIGSFFGLNASDMEAANYALVDDILSPYPNARWFLQESSRHTMLGDPYGERTADGTILADWIRQLLEGDPAWSSHDPR